MMSIVNEIKGFVATVLKDLYQQTLQFLQHIMPSKAF